MERECVFRTTHNMNKITQNPQWKVGTTNNSITNRNTGNVGIGTTAPNAPLHIYAARSGATLNSTPMLRLEDSTAEGINVGPELLFLGTAGGVGTGYASIHAAKENSTAGNYATYLRFGTRANGGSMTEQVRITSDGNVGIGTTGPENTLHVAGSFGHKVTTVTSVSHTAASETVILCDTATAGGDITITLPAATNSKDRIYHIKKIDAGAGRVIVIS